MKNPTTASIGLLTSDKRCYPGVDLLYHVAYYHAARVGYQDIISRSLHDFKDGVEPQTSRWIRLAVPAAAAQLDCDVIIRALGSAEECASGGSPLDRLCSEIAKACGARYAPELLSKTRMIRPLTTLAGRALRQRELDGVYKFAAEGLAPNVRVMIVDDLVTTGSTVGTIAKAVRALLPEASVTCFVLARVEAQLQNSHLNPGYFLHGGDIVPHAKEEENAKKHKTPPAPPVPAQKPHSSTARPSASVRQTPLAHNAPSAQKSQRPVPDGRMKPAAPVQKRGGGNRVYVVGLVLSLVVLGATVLLPAKNDPGSPPPQFATLVAENSVHSPDPIPSRREVPGQSQNARPAIVTVPGTGLRANHSMDSKVLPKAAVRLKERVEILRRFSSELGPDWIQVRTRTGAVGWVVASVVKEVKG